eukprot:TRINITY_DN96659_c0_g1_i1.p1 TRINITY_DN96659_c0_g1~~TRINITY_DN96659_c0_g1_i1.p1  ORF type:complete len:191 (+),score=5.26 TRINITY_DN96659_c0_g1_i1:53-574(+)
MDVTRTNTASKVTKQQYPSYMSSPSSSYSSPRYNPSSGTPRSSVGGSTVAGAPLSPISQHSQIPPTPSSVTSMHSATSGNMRHSHSYSSALSTAGYGHPIPPSPRRRSPLPIRPKSPTATSPRGVNSPLTSGGGFMMTRAGSSTYTAVGTPISATAASGGRTTPHKGPRPPFH